MAVSPYDFVSFYSRALQGEFFAQPETLRTFRSVLADAIPSGFPLGVNAFVKGGSIDFAGAHALSLADGMYVADRWGYFCLIINWTDAQAGLVAEVLPAFDDDLVYGTNSVIVTTSASRRTENGIEPSHRALGTTPSSTN